MAETRQLSTLDIINEFPGVCGSVYLNTAAEGLFMRSHGAALQRYAELKQMGARGRDGCLAIEWRARELAATLLGVDPQNIAFLASTARGLDVTIKSIGWRLAGSGLALRMLPKSNLLPLGLCFRPLARSQLPWPAR